MCGIFCYQGSTDDVHSNVQSLDKCSDKLKHRGPDDSSRTIKDYPDDRSAYFKFHRLAINDLSSHGMQPFTFDSESGEYTLLMNGEIWNWSELRETHCPDYSYVSTSDCEVVLPLFIKYGSSCFEMLDGEFACVIIDPAGQAFAARDGTCGIRPLFYCKRKNGAIIYASEAKGIVGLVEHDEIIQQFPPGHYISDPLLHEVSPFMTFQKSDQDMGDCVVSFYDEEDSSEMTSSEIFTEINTLLTDAVKKRIEVTDVPVALLVSGGLDSSLVAAIARKEFPDLELHSFSVGLPDSKDLIAAREVADRLKLIHHELVCTAEDGINAIPDVIYSLETWDQTTIYAGTYQWLLCKYIHEQFGFKVLLGGELADEVNGSYRYIGLAPTISDAIEENRKLLSEVHFYDVLRADRTLSAHSIESRVPFSDRAFMKFMVSIDIAHRMPTETIEKEYLRKAFDPEWNGIDYEYLPKELLWRRKEAFSDGVGHSWVGKHKEHVNSIVTDEELELAKLESHIYTKDDLYFRRIFNEMYEDRVELIPHKWIPNQDWEHTQGVTESSARFLYNY